MKLVSRDDDTARGRLKHDLKGGGPLQMSCKLAAASSGAGPGHRTGTEGNAAGKFLQGSYLPPRHQIPWRQAISLDVSHVCCTRDVHKSFQRCAGPRISVLLSRLVSAMTLAS